jgi:NAD+ kinase
MTRVVVVAKRTSWATYVEQTRDPLVIELLRRHDPTVARMRAAHEAHEQAVAAVDRALVRLGVEPRRVENAAHPFSTEGAALVLTVGGDGTLLTASHQVSGLPVLGVNSAPGFSVGFFCGASADTIDEALERALDGDLTSVTLARMEVRCNDELISRRVLNDALLCHSCPAATSRYILELGTQQEEHRSSGIWVGPAAGSTAAQHSAGGEVLPLDSENLQLVVREPYNPHGEPLKLRRAEIKPDESLLVRSKMYDARLFLDGPANHRVVTLGDVLVFRRSPDPLSLLALNRDRMRNEAGMRGSLSAI